MAQSIAELYPQLYLKAVEIVSGSVIGYDVYRWREIAHDITVDFLFFSMSFRETYCAPLGALNPFFNSYVRKKCMGERDKMKRERLRTIPLDNVVKPFSVGNFDKIYEIIQLTNDSYDWLKRFNYRSIRGKSFCLADVFVVCLESVMLYGKVNLLFMQKKLGTDKTKIKSMLIKMRRILRERWYAKNT